MAACPCLLVATSFIIATKGRGREEISLSLSVIMVLIGVVAATGKIRDVCGSTCLDGGGEREAL